LNPTVPADAQHNTSPLVSVTEMIVLLNVALMWTMPRETFRLAFFFLLLAMVFRVLVSSSPGNGNGFRD
jgi:hypothetical protein